MPPRKSRKAFVWDYLDPNSRQGFVPPHLARKLSRFAFTDDPLYVADIPPQFSLDCEQIYRIMPCSFWESKCDELTEVADQRDALNKRLREGKGVREELLAMRAELQARIAGLATGYTVIYCARSQFATYLKKRGVRNEHWWQALEEYAEGAGGGLSLYWPEAARRQCSEGALVRADWVVQRFAKEREVTGGLPPPQLAFLHSPPPGLASRPPLPIVIVPPRHPSSTFTSASGVDAPPPYTPPSTSDSPSPARHSADSGHRESDLINLQDQHASSAQQRRVPP